MNVREVLEEYRQGKIDLQRAERLLRMDFLERVGDHTLFDHAREARRGIPEVIWGENKSPAMVADIVRMALQDRDAVMVSRATQEHLEALREVVDSKYLRFIEGSGIIVADRRPDRPRIGLIGIMTAGSSDIAVAEEAKAMAELMGCEVLTEYDIGVAALHRFLEPLAKMLDRGVDALVVVAGMEGALPTVVSGLADVPIIGVPTSVGYGYGGKGKAALMGMLQTCSPGLVVVNIDNGIAAGATAALISLRCRRQR
ncbi:MAG: nickel pincer cofactor biosynthesis protein LarB [Methanomassiliicoccales archaeon]|nr:nickel pincer cofactor biosynthesis protein LarB [Methanomassiliicoccales archaeon]